MKIFEMIQGEIQKFKDVKILVDSLTAQSIEPMPTFMPQGPVIDATAVVVDDNVKALPSPKAEE